MKVVGLKRGLQQVLNHQGIRRYGANTLWLFAEQVLRMVAGFLVGLWIARYLGPEKFGLFSYALAFVSIFQGIAQLGLDGIVVRDLVKEPEKRDVYLGTSFWLKLAGGVLIFLIILIISYLTADTFQTFLFINIIAGRIIFQSFEVIDFYYQATVQTKYISLRKMIHLILSSIIKIILVLIKADLIWFVLVTLFDAISLAIFSWFIYKDQGLPNFLKYFDRDMAKRLLNDSWPLLLSSIALMIYMRIDQVMIKNMLGDREVGLYSAAIKLVEVWYFIPMIITQSVFPAIVNAKKISEEVYNKRLQQLYTLMAWTSITIALPITFLSNWIINFLYGAEYLPASRVLSISIWAGVFVFLGVASSQYLLAENYTKISFIRTFVGACFNLFLNLLLIPIFKIEGAAIATLLSYFITVFFIVFIPRVNKQVLLIIKSLALPFKLSEFFKTKKFYSLKN